MIIIIFGSCDNSKHEISTSNRGIEEKLDENEY